jgi:hypothetical protein
MDNRDETQALADRLRLLMSGDAVLAKTDFAKATLEQAIAALSRSQDELESHKSMLGEACHDLGLIHEALGLDPDEAGGAAPILQAIEELKRARSQDVARVAEGWQLVPIEPTETMVVVGFESWPNEFFSSPEEWEAFEAMSGCQQAAHKAKLCYAAMLAAAPAAPAVAPAIAAIEYALKADEGMEFLRVWLHGQFDVIRDEWPDAPQAVFVAAPAPAEPKGEQQAIADKPQDAAIYQSIADNYARDLKPEQRATLSKAQVHAITQAIQRCNSVQAFGAAKSLRALLAANNGGSNE